jgi:hypothetical protein
MKKINIPVPVSGRRDRIKKYLLVLYQFHKLTDKEINLLTELIFYYTDYVDQYGDKLANKLLFDKDTSIQIRKNLDNMADTVYRNYLSNLRKKNVITGRTLNTKFIPPLNNFELSVSFYERDNKGNSK